MLCGVRLLPGNATPRLIGPLDQTAAAHKTLLEATLTAAITNSKANQIEVPLKGVVTSQQANHASHSVPYKQPLGAS